MSAEQQGPQKEYLTFTMAKLLYEVIRGFLILTLTEINDFSFALSCVHLTRHADMNIQPMHTLHFANYVESGNSEFLIIV